VIDGRWTGAVCGRRALPSLVVVLLAASAFAQRPASGPALAPNRPLSADQVERYVDTLEELVALGERPVVDPTEARRKGPGLVYEGKVRARLEAHGFDARSFREAHWRVVTAWASLIWDERRAAAAAEAGDAASPADVERAVAALTPPPALADVPAANKALVAAQRRRLDRLLGGG
jgi:hypothetical protein